MSSFKCGKLTRSRKKRKDVGYAYLKFKRKSQRGFIVWELIAEKKN